ncbi:D-alanine--D-alanine ligase family protein [Treponema phagedenis]|uniref:D-alanine--D-alanine ligase family protein n=1 Tax=Treponema phagedenis TaxID=162 RepID=UPI0001F63C31|nr:D-alanine--D-alanine ligase family protein [Treponema phagedenis]EFW37993.1 D-ala D-ala ligase N-terminal domain protein [Treponema phagedenis F0421]TYT79163.1 D-alanine--D-alanine ligase [Treponema phagedenis]
MNIAIMYGGKSSEHEVSLVSATSIVRNINSLHTIHLIGITKQGTWFLQNQDELMRIRSDEQAVLQIHTAAENQVSIIPGGGTKGALKVGQRFLETDVIFPVLHGSFGEDGTIQGLFEMAELPYVGCGVLASSLSMDKEKTKNLCQAAGLPIVPFFTVRKNTWDIQSERDLLIQEIEKELDYPLFVKPCRAGSSVGAGIAKDKNELLSRAEEAFSWDYKILVEACIPAREIECSVTGNETCIAYTPGEIIPSHSFYDYEAKYTDPDGAILKIPAEITDDERKTIREIAMKAYKTLDLSGFARVDFFIDKKTKKIYLNEINTIPGFTSISMFPKMCAASGLPYPDLITLLLQLAIERFDSERKLKTSRGK